MMVKFVHKFQWHLTTIGRYFHFGHLLLLFEQAIWRPFFDSFSNEQKKQPSLSTASSVSYSRRRFAKYGHYSLCRFWENYRVMKNIYQLQIEKLLIRRDPNSIFHGCQTSQVEVFSLSIVNDFLHFKYFNRL